MRNKRGFTLIELLAIIVILAIIAVITIPIILDIISNAERNSSIDSAHGYKDALQKYYANKSIRNPDLELPNGYINISDLPSDFIISGEVPSAGWVKLKKGSVERYSLKYKGYVVTMDSDKNVVSKKQQNVEPHVTSDYQEVEYLESNGTQYINTRIIGESKWDVTAQYTSASEASQILVGCGSSAAQWFGQRNNNYAVGVDSSFVFNSSSLEKNDISLSFTSNKLTATISDSIKNRNGSLNGNNFYLFGFSSSNDSFYSSARIYKADVYKNEQKVRHFVPVIRKSDSKPGMLDLASYSDNLFNPYTVIKGRQDNGVVGYENGTTDLYVADNTIYLTTNTTWRGFTSDYIAVSSRDYHISIPSQSGMSVSCSQYDENKQFIKKATLNTQLEENCKYIRFTITFENVGEYQVSNIMLNEGTESLPYESYGYKFYTNNGTGEFVAGPEI